jgi:hypothetical protein
MRNKALAIVATLAIVVAAAGCAGGAGGGGLGSNSISNAEYAQVHTGMTAAQVRSILGKPETIDNSQISGIGKGSDWTYSGPNDTSVMITLGQKLNLTGAKPSGPLLVDSKMIG